MKTKNEVFEVCIPSAAGDAIAYKVPVNIQLEWDEEVQQWLIGPEANRLIEDTKARHMGLLLPAQFKQLRERYNYTQSQIGELFQVGEKSWTRWESGKQRPSRSISLLIRALYEGEISLNYLLKRAGKPVQPEADTLIHALWASWKAPKGPAPEFASLHVYHSIGAPKSVAVHLHSGKGKSALVAQLVKLVHRTPGSAAELPIGQPLASRQRYEVPAPPHPDPQPRLTQIPTVA